jgi:hypothetical protein
MPTKRNMVLSYKASAPSSLYTMTNTQKTVIDANNMLSNHKFDNYKSQACQSGKDKKVQQELQG